MKNLKLLVFALTVFMVVPMFGQTAAQMKFTAPFEFTIDNHVMPAGAYVVQQVNDAALLIRSLDGNKVARVSLTESAGGGVLYKAPSMTFVKVGDKHYLSAAWFGGTSIGRQFAKHKQTGNAASEPTVLSSASN